MNTAKRFIGLKNKLFIKNAKDPNNQQFVKSIWKKKITKLGRAKWDIVWQYYRDRKRISVNDLYKKFNGEELKVIYSGIPQPNIFMVEEIHFKTKEQLRSEMSPEELAEEKRLEELKIKKRMEKKERHRLLKLKRKKEKKFKNNKN